MKQLYLILPLLCTLTATHAQKHDNLWLYGYFTAFPPPNGGCTLDFGEEPPVSYVSERGSNTAKSNDSPKLLIFPNPASNKITVSYPTNRVSAVILYNHIGHEVARVLPAGEQSTLAFDVSSFPPGLYICRVFQAGKPILSKKVIIVK